MDNELQIIVSIIKDAVSTLAAIGVIISCATYIHQRKLARANRERERREKVISITGDFIKAMTTRSSAVEKLLKFFTHEQREAIENGTSFSVDKKYHDLVEAALPESCKPPEPAHESSHFELTSKQVFYIRWEIITRLNSLELVAQSWFMDIALRRIIEDEFTPILLEKQFGKNILTLTSGISNVESFPALAALVQKLEERRNPYKSQLAMMDSIY